MAIQMREFRKPVDSAGFNKSKAFAEWEALETLVKTQYTGFKFIEVSSQLFKNPQKKFPDILLLVELILTFSLSNSATEKVLSTLITLLSDSKLRLKY